MLRWLLVSAATLLAAPGAAAQTAELAELFDQDPFYEEAGVLRGKGEIPFFADVSFLAGPGDSTRVVLGIALSNRAFQFVKEDAGYRAAYEVALEAKGARGSFRTEWRETIRAGTFDETLLERETVVFQSAFALLPGDYDLELRVRDAQGGESSKVETELTVPRLQPGSSGYALSQPVLLRSFAEGGADPREHVLYPSHYFQTVPTDVAFYAEVYAGPGAAPGPLQLAGAIRPGDGGEPLGTATFDVPELADGRARVYGRVPGRGMQSGIFELELALRDQTGAELARNSTRFSVSAITRWVKENWKEAIEILAYEANDDEREALEATPADRRLEAWEEFWAVRDPVPATPANEAFESYFRRIAVANANFGTKLRPGWKSDRGRVFVAFGPPSDVIRRPLPEGSFPLEIWVYDRPGFEIVFEDRIGFGNYQMVNPGTFANELGALERRKQRAIADRRAAREQKEEEEEREEGATDEGAGGAAPDTTGSEAPEA